MGPERALDSLGSHTPDHPPHLGPQSSPCPGIWEMSLRRAVMSRVVSESCTRRERSAPAERARSEDRSSQEKQYRWTSARPKSCIPEARAHSPSLRHSAASTRASRETTLASMARAGTGGAEEEEEEEERTRRRRVKVRWLEAGDLHFRGAGRGRGWPRRGAKWGGTGPEQRPQRGSGL